jgi:transcriptional regulator with XRE-family HTH domain
MDLGSRLRRLRLARGMTQKDLAGGRYTHAYVSSIETGRRRPSREALEHLASRLGVDVDELITGRPADLGVRLGLRLHEARLALEGSSAGRIDNELGAIGREASRHALPLIQAGAEQALGTLLERRGRPRQALMHHRRAEALLRDASPVASANAVVAEASCHAAMGELRYAIHLLDALLRDLDQRGLRDPDTLARVHAALVLSHVRAGSYAKAATSADELDRLASRAADPIAISRMHAEVAQVHLANGRIREAEEALRRADDALGMLHVHAVRGHSHLARGHLAAQDGRLEEARHHLNEAVRLFERSGDENNLGRALNELARVERLAGEAARARALLERSISVVGGGDPAPLAWAHRELGLLLSEVDGRAAERHLRTAVELYARVGSREDLAAAYRSLGEHLEAAGNPEAAAEAYRTGILTVEPKS